MKATLRMILECNGVMYYDVVQYNLTFQTFKSYMMSFAELYNFCKETESTDRDFGIEDAMLKCNPILRKVSVDEKTLETMEELGEQVLGKLQNMTDEEFEDVSLKVIE